MGGVRKCVGNGEGTKFWKEVWVGEVSLGVKFSRLFSVSVQQEGCIRDMGRWGGGGWEWDLRWRRNLFEWEKELLADLLQAIGVVSVIRDKRDSWCWTLDSSGGYTVKSAFAFIADAERGDGERTGDNMDHAFFKGIWCNLVPSKVAALAWKIGLQRMPTMANIIRSGVQIQNNLNGVCVLCNDQVETTSHLFFECNFSYSVWMTCLKWVGLSSALPNDGRMHFLQHVLGDNYVVVEKGWRVV